MDLVNKYKQLYNKNGSDYEILSESFEDLSYKFVYEYIIRHVKQVQYYMLMLVFKSKELTKIKEKYNIDFDFNNLFEQVYLRSLNHDSDKFTNNDLIKAYGFIFMYDAIQLVDKKARLNESSLNKIKKYKEIKRNIHYKNQRHHFYFKECNNKIPNFLDILEAVCDCYSAASRKGQSKENQLKYFIEVALKNQNEDVKNIFLDLTELVYNINENDEKNFQLFIQNYKEILDYNKQLFELRDKALNKENFSKLIKLLFNDRFLSPNQYNYNLQEVINSFENEEEKQLLNDLYK